MAFSEIGKIQEVVPGSMKSFVVGNKKILLVNVGGRFFAINGKCTHMGGDLSKGKLDGTVVTCPRHGSRFDVTTGKNLSGPKILFMYFTTADEKAYPVKIVNDTIQIDVD